MTRHRLAALFESESLPLRRFLSRFASPEAADDLAQETFARLCGADAGTMESPRSFLFRIARNLAINEARHRRIVPMELVADPDTLGAISSDPSPEDQIVLADELGRLQRALDQLPAKQREALLLFKLEGFTHKEVGVRLGVSPRTVERYVADAIAHCYLALKAQAREE